MKKVNLIILCSALILNSSCATILRGSGTECQKKSAPNKEIRVGMVLLDLIWVFPLNAIFLITDAKTGAIYKPCETTK